MKILSVQLEPRVARKQRDLAACYAQCLVAGYHSVGTSTRCSSRRSGNYRNRLLLAWNRFSISRVDPEERLSGSAGVCIDDQPSLRFWSIPLQICSMPLLIHVLGWGMSGEVEDIYFDHAAVGIGSYLRSSATAEPQPN